MGTLILVFIFIYLIPSFCLYVIAKKLKSENSWLAFIPIASGYLMCELAEKPGWWIILFFIPVINIIITFIVGYNLAKVRGKQPWTGILLGIPLLNYFALLHLAFDERRPFWLALGLIIIPFQIFDFIIHSVILADAYAATAGLWRSIEDMNLVLIYILLVISTIGFIFTYDWFVGNKSTTTGLMFGILFGFVWGISIGYGSYSVMPIPYNMALTWFLGTLVEMGYAGWILGVTFKTEEAKESPVA